MISRSVNHTHILKDPCENIWQRCGSVGDQETVCDDGDVNNDAAAGGDEEDGGGDEEDDLDGIYFPFSDLISQPGKNSTT